MLLARDGSLVSLFSQLSASLAVLATLSELQLWNGAEAYLDGLAGFYA